ncbi:hypothetical protein [Haladaptatus sp. NG-SE-30]
MSKDNTPGTADRRAFLKAVGAGTATSMTISGTVGAHDKDSLDDQVTKVKDATSKYTNPQKALDDGYQVMGPYVTGMGWHFMHHGRVQAAAKNGLTLTEPQLLTYGDTGEGIKGLVLGAVEYAIPVGAGDFSEENPPDLFDDEDSAETWHTHHSAEHVFAMRGDPRSEKFPESITDVPPAERVRSTRWLEISPGGKPGEPMLEPKTALVGDLRGDEVTNARMVVSSSVHPDLLTLHAWVHQNNPEGVFAEINPELPNQPMP